MSNEQNVTVFIQKYFLQKSNALLKKMHRNYFFPKKYSPDIFFSSKNALLKGVCHEIFDLQFFS